jgi:hypothetical protein
MSCFYADAAGSSSCLCQDVRGKSHAVTFLLCLLICRMLCSGRAQC